MTGPRRPGDRDDRAGAVPFTGRVDAVAGLRPVVGGALLRVAVLVAGTVALLAVVAGREVGPVVVAVTGLLLLAAALAPDSPAAAGFLVVLVALQGAVGGPDLRLPFVVTGAYLVHAGCALAAVVDLRAVVERSALRAPARRAALVLAGTAAAAGLLAGVRGAGLRTGDGVAVVAAVALGGVVLRLLSRSR